MTARGEMMGLAEMVPYGPAKPWWADEQDMRWKPYDRASIQHRNGMLGRVQFFNPRTLFWQNCRGETAKQIAACLKTRALTDEGEGE